MRFLRIFPAIIILALSTGCASITRDTTEAFAIETIPPGAAGMAGNVLIGGIISAGIDAGTGAMHSHKPNPLKVH